MSNVCIYPKNVVFFLLAFYQRPEFRAIHFFFSNNEQSMEQAYIFVAELIGRRGNIQCSCGCILVSLSRFSLDNDQLRLSGVSIKARI